MTDVKSPKSTEKPAETPAEKKPPIDLDKWLAENKLTNKEKEIKERNVTVEQLADMNPDQLKEFADAIGLDTLARKRFIKALQSLKPGPPPSSVPSQVALMAQRQSVNLSGAFGGLGPIQYRLRDDGSAVVVTPQEHEMITQLYERFVRTALLLQNLNGCSQILEYCTQQCKDDINKKMDMVIQQLGERKQILKEDMARLRGEKADKLDQQLQTMRSYQSELEDGKKQYEQAISDSSLDVHSRKKKIIGSVNDLTGRKDIQLTLATQPKFRLAFENQMVTTFLDQLTIDDCDQPPPPVIKIMRVSFDSVAVEITCDDEVLINKATEIAVEVALINTDSRAKPKKRRVKTNVKAKKGKGKGKDKDKDKDKKKKKKKGSDSESGSGSGSDDEKKGSSDENSEKGSDEDGDKSEASDKSEAEESEEEDKSEEEEEEEENTEESDDDNKKSKRKKGKKKDKEETDKDKKDVEKVKIDEVITSTTVTSGEQKKGDSPGPSEASGDKDKEDVQEEVPKVDVKEMDMNKLQWEEANFITIPKKFLDASRYKSDRKYSCVVDQLLDKSEYAVRARAKNRSGWGDWCVPQTLTTKKLIIDSKILKPKEKKQLMKWLPSKDRQRRWKLMFRASKHGFNGSQFHAKCDNKGAPTICIIESTAGHVFGGYTTLPWTSNNNYASDTKSWIYLVRASKSATTKSGKWKVTQTQYSVYHNNSYGPSFGGGYDFYLASGCNTNTSSYANAGHSYACPKNNTLLAGQYNFMVKDYEVYLLEK